MSNRINLSFDFRRKTEIRAISMARPAREKTWVASDHEGRAGAHRGPGRDAIDELAAAQEQALCLSPCSEGTTF